MKNKYLKQLLNLILIPALPDEYGEEYRRLKFNTNNIRMLVVASVLTAEQFILAFTVAENGSLLQKIYLASSAGMLFFVFTGFYLHNHAPERISLRYELLETAFAFFGMSVAVVRFFVHKGPVFSIPTIYVAVLYGIAVIFVFNRRQVLLLYSAITLTTLIFLPRVHPEILISNFRSDIITNGFISAIILMLNTRRFVSSFLDKKRIESINNELTERSIRDSLTGLFNRRKMDELYSDACRKSGRYNSNFSLIMADIDHFKNINDSYGHHTGDRVLTEFSAVIESSARDVDYCGRWGGEEFLVICRETDLESAAQFAERLRQVISETLFAGEHHITASFGVASWKEFPDAAVLLRAADSRMYAAKTSGRNMVVSDGS